MPLPIRVVPRAERQIVAIHRWWSEERPANPGLFRDELGAAFDLIGTAPAAGKRYPDSPIANVRRVLLRSTRYHVYYQAKNDEVIVLAVWHTARGNGPSFT